MLFRSQNRAIAQNPFFAQMNLKRKREYTRPLASETALLLVAATLYTDAGLELLNLPAHVLGSGS